MKTNPLVRLFNLVLLDKKEITSIYFLAILNGLVQLSLPLGVQAIISFALGATMVTSIYVLIIIVVIGVWIVGILQVNQIKIIERIQQKIFTRNAFDFAETIPKIDLLKSNNYYLPEKINRFFDTLSIQKGVSKLLLDIPIASIQVIFGILLLSFYHPIFIGFGLLLLSTLFFILKLTSRKGWTTSLEESKNKYAMVSWFGEMARVIKSFKFRQSTHLNLTKTDETVVGYLRARTSHFKVLLFQYKALILFKVLITASMLVMGTYLLLNQQLNIGEFIAAEIIILTVINAIEKLIGSLDSVYDVITGLEKLANVTESSIEKSGNIPYTSNGKGMTVELINCELEFTPLNKVLQHLNFTLPSSSLICITGDEGTGKTSLLNFISGNYQTENGGLLINNVPFQNYQLESLRNRMGIFLNQEDIFEGTVLENITVGRNEITVEKINEIAQKIGFKGFINNFKNGFETILDPAGRKIASSLVTKILLLRAFVNEPELLLLEEPWRDFNQETKKSIIEYLFQLSHKKTICIVTNNEDFIAMCDYTIHLENNTGSLSKIIK